MDFEWDEAKRLHTIEKRGVDILYAAGIFEGPVLTYVDPRDYGGEMRSISIGLVDDECFIVVHTERHGTVRLITAWKGGRNDRKRYEARLAR